MFISVYILWYCVETRKMALKSQTAKAKKKKKIIIIKMIKKNTVSCDFQQCGILTSVDSDVPAQPPFRTPNDVQSVAQRS